MLDDRDDRLPWNSNRLAVGIGLIPEVEDHEVVVERECLHAAQEPQGLRWIPSAECTDRP
jgi:hypothetical protein